MMTVTDLIEELSKFPGNLKVIVSKDSEGNGFSPLSDTCDGYYLSQTTWAGDYYSDPEDARELGARPAVFLWPTN
jgi:hypothetical protein